MKLINIFPNYDTFKSDVIDKLNLLFPNVEWLNEQNSYMSFQTLYGLLNLYYGDRDIRYDNSQTFINKFTFDLADVLPDIYAKQQVFINNELKTYLSSAHNRAIKIQGGTTSNRQQNNNSKAANSTTPANIVITNANELDRLPITSANLSDITLIDNINSSNEQTNFKYIDDLIKNLTSDYSLRLKEFMNLIKNHFTFIDTSNIQQPCDGLYKGTRFRNGYYVSNVDYLCLENQEQIKLTNGKVQTNTTNIEKLQSSIGSLPDFDALNQQVKKNKTDIIINTNDITNLKAKDSALENTINTNEQNITTNTIDINNIKIKQTTQDQQIQANKELSNQIINGLKTLRIFNYVGTYNPTTTYNKNECVDYNDRLFLSKIDNNIGNNPPSNNESNNYWLLINSIQASVDLSNYYTKNEIDNKLQDYLIIATYNKNQEILNTRIRNIEENNIEQDNLINQKLNKNDFNNYQQSNDNKVNELSRGQQTNTNAINNMKWVPLTNITYGNNRTTINLEGKRFIHFQGRFTNYKTNTGSWNNFTPFIIDTQNYNYMVRFPIFDWNTQRLNGSIEVVLENGNLILIGYNTNNQQTNYYLWGDVVGSN